MTSLDYYLKTLFSVKYSTKCLKIPDYTLQRVDMKLFCSTHMEKSIWLSLDTKIHGD